MHQLRSFRDNILLSLQVTFNSTPSQIFKMLSAAGFCQCALRRRVAESQQKNLYQLLLVLKWNIKINATETKFPNFGKARRILMLWPAIVKFLVLYGNFSPTENKNYFPSSSWCQNGLSKENRLELVLANSKCLISVAIYCVNLDKIKKCLLSLIKLIKRCQLRRNWEPTCSIKSCNLQ